MPRLPLLFSLTLALAPLGACSADDLPDVEHARGLGTATSPLRAEDIATFAAVRTSGSGCPPGTANTRISPDGLAFTTTFASYTVQIDPSAEVSVRDCDLDITLHTPTGRSYAVQAFYYAGFALLQEGVTGRQTASYFFEGNPVAPLESNRTQLAGPFDDDYLFKEEVPIEDQVWSPCAQERSLHVSTRVQLFNGAPRRAGYMNLSAADGSARLSLTLAARPCGQTNPQKQLAKATAVTIQPARVRQDEHFTIRWTRPRATSAQYYARIHYHHNFGFAKIWQSPLVSGSSIEFTGAPLPKAGVYEVIVVARDGGAEVESDPVLLTVDEVPALAALQPGSARLAPTSIQRANPFTVSWAPPPGATSDLTYRVEIHNHIDWGYGLIWASPETRALALTYRGPPLPQAGTYHVVVIGSAGGRSTRSELLPLQAFD